MLMLMRLMMMKKVAGCRGQEAPFMLESTPLELPWALRCSSWVPPHFPLSRRLVSGRTQPSCTMRRDMSRSKLGWCLTTCVKG